MGTFWLVAENGVLLGIHGLLTARALPGASAVVPSIAGGTASATGCPAMAGAAAPSSVLLLEELQNPPFSKHGISHSLCDRYRAWAAGLIQEATQWLRL